MNGNHDVRSDGWRLMNRRRALQVAGLGAVGMLGLMTAVPVGAVSSPRMNPTPWERFRMAMRKLWEDHITWTRLFIVSFTADLPDLEATTGRLLRNQDDLGQAFAPFYGEQTADHIRRLLRAHILGAAALLSAAKSGDANAVDAAREAWYANANEIAAFLHNLNPKFWPLEELRSMMRAHLDLTLAEAVAHLTGDFTGDVDGYDAVHAEILEMSDFLANGLIARFPDVVVPL